MDDATKQFIGGVVDALTTRVENARAALERNDVKQLRDVLGMVMYSAGSALDATEFGVPTTDVPTTPTTGEDQ